jgi:hypothetical protein
MPTQFTTKEILAKLSLASTKLTGLSLPGKIQELKRSRSSDPVQQLQTEAIIELYDAVKQIQEAIWPILLIIPDGIDAARKAAEGQGAIGTSVAKLVPIKRLTR